MFGWIVKQNERRGGVQRDFHFLSNFCLATYLTMATYYMRTSFFFSNLKNFSSMEIVLTDGNFDALGPLKSISTFFFLSILLKWPFYVMKYDKATIGMAIFITEKVSTLPLSNISQASSNGQYSSWTVKND